MLENKTENNAYASLAAWERAVKKKVHAQTWRARAVCTPGFEGVLSAELRALGFKPLAPEAGKLDPHTLGGVEWDADLVGIHKAALELGTANRLWLRVCEFRAGAMEELFRKTYAFPWELWLSKDDVLDVHAEVRQSKLSHEGRAAHTVTQAIARRLRKVVIPDAIPARAGEQRVLVRVVDNHAQLSLDVSGELHYKRGRQAASVLAPMRESLANGLVRSLAPEFSGDIVDAMSGSGTFGLEAMSVRDHIASGLWRSFRLESFPGLSNASARHQRIQALSRTSPGTGGKLWLYDIAPEAVAASLANAEAFLDPFSIRVDDASVMSVQQADFFQLEPPSPRRGLLCLNPPYGLRMDADTDRLYTSLSRRIASSWGGWRVILIVPEAKLLEKLPSGVRLHRFRHGGLHVIAACWTA